MTVARRIHTIESLRRRRDARVAAHQSVRDIDGKLVPLVAQQLRWETKTERRGKTR